MVRLIGFAVFAVSGLALLLGLGVWQVQRLAWKTEILDRIETRIADAPTALPSEPTEAEHEYQPVSVTGEILDPELHILTTTETFGPSYRVIRPFRTAGGRRILVDLGAIPTTAKEAARPGGTQTINGNLLWPDETDGFTPDPDRGANIWFARDLPAMAADAGTDPVLIVARSDTGMGPQPVPVTVEGIPNDHLQYAITWFSLAAIWAGMTVLLLWRMAVRR